MAIFFSGAYLCLSTENIKKLLISVDSSSLVRVHVRFFNREFYSIWLNFEIWNYQKQFFFRVFVKFKVLFNIIANQCNKHVCFFFLNFNKNYRIFGVLKKKYFMHFDFKCLSLISWIFFLHFFDFFFVL